MIRAAATPIRPTAPALYPQRLKLAQPDENVVLRDTISKEPFSPVVRQGDDRWFNLVKWTHFALLDAEELGVDFAKCRGDAQVATIPKSAACSASRAITARASA